MKAGAPTLAAGMKERDKILSQMLGIPEMHQQEDKNVKRAIANKGFKKLAKKARQQRLAEES